MSAIPLTKVWPLQMPPTPKAVLVCLVCEMDSLGVCMQPIEILCDRTCFGRTAVSRAIGWLEDHGYIETEQRAGRPTRYRIGEMMFHVAQVAREANR